MTKGITLIYKKLRKLSKEEFCELLFCKIYLQHHSKENSFACDGINFRLV